MAYHNPPEYAEPFCMLDRCVAPQEHVIKWDKHREEEKKKWKKGF
jgi:hypothetical protein